MLVLSRKVNEKFFVGPDVRITVVDIRGGKIRIGIEAPKDVEVLREELVDPALAMTWAERMAKKGVK